MKREILKLNNKGISMVDLIVAMLVLCMLVGVIGNLYYQIISNNYEVQLNATAVYYMVKIAEDTDRMAYEDVTNDLNEIIRSNYNIPDYINITLDVKNYNESNSSKEDIIKIVNLKAEYKYFENTRTFEIEKIKVKEI